MADRTTWIIVALVTSLCSAAADAMAQAPGLLVSPDWLAQRLDDPEILILHVDGSREQYDAGHIPGARFVPANEIAVDPPGGSGYEIPALEGLRRTLDRAGVDGRRHVVVYTAGPSPLAATRLWLTLDYVGLGDRASILDGMFQRWTAERRPVTTDVPDDPSTAGFTPRPNPGLLVDAEWILERLDDEEMVLIDARPDDEYTGDDGGMGGMANPGHIPGAAQLYYEDLIVDRRTNPSFLPIEELRTRFEAAGAGPGKEVVTYCMIGMRASLTYFVGRLLGYEMRFYDGSWHDWGTRDLPFVGGPNRR